jgi:hypothetical protein
MEYELEIANLQRQVAELAAKYETQTKIDASRNATQIGLADLNNASRERVATINADMQLSREQLLAMHEQGQTAFEASNAAESEIRNHGLQITQQALQQQAAQTQAQIQASQQAQQTGLEHATTMEQSAQQHAQELQKLAAQPPTPPQGAI